MCIAIFKPADKKLSKEMLQRCFTANSDGAGYMYNHDGKLKIKKGFMTFDRFWASFNNLQHKTAVIHFRFKTHGEADETNTHPFLISPTLGFVHNGIITDVSTASNKNMSDTWHFNEQILKGLYKLSPDFVDNEAAQLLIQKFIGYSKLIFMDNQENVWIMNEDKGVWDDGVWYSNSGYLPKKETTIVTYPAKQGEYIPRYKGRFVSKKDIYQDMTKLEVNTIVNIRNDYMHNGKLVKKDTQGIVETFYQDHTVGVLFFTGDSNSEYVRVPFYLLDISEDDIIVNPYTHNFDMM